jgi:hypothetical protein
VLNFAWYQLLWFVAVVGGPVLAWLLPLLLALHLLQVRDWRSELLLMLAAASIGGAFDTVLALAGYFRFDALPGPLPVPLWLLAIWMGFAATLRHSMRHLVARPRLMTAAAGCCAPLSYLAAERLGAVSFPLGTLPTAVAVGLSWLTLAPVLIRLAALADGRERVTAGLRHTMSNP